MFDKVEYEYYLLLGSQEVKADYCSSILFDNYCEYNGYRINDPVYKTIEVSRIENYYLKGFNFLSSPVILLILPFLLLFIFFFLLEKIESRKNKNEQ